LINLGTTLAVKMRTVETAAMAVSWSVIYISLPIGSFLIILSTLALMVKRIKSLSKA